MKRTLVFLQSKSRSFCGTANAKAKRKEKPVRRPSRPIPNQIIFGKIPQNTPATTPLGPWRCSGEQKEKEKRPSGGPLGRFPTKLYLVNPKQHTCHHPLWGPWLCSSKQAAPTRQEEEAANETRRNPQQQQQPQRKI